MDNESVIELLREQLRLSCQREQLLLEQLQQQSIQIEKLTETVRSLEASLLHKKGSIQTLTNRNKGLGKLLSNKSEKVAVVSHLEPRLEKLAYCPKQRGNNNSRRKEFFDLETIIEEVYPNDPGFDRDNARVISHVDSILYECIPARFIKHIYRQYNCLQDGRIYSGKSPKAPLLNSNYDGSFIAGILQLRYIYSMPIERIVKYFCEHGFELNKATAHGLVRKSAQLMERLDKVLKKAILEDQYLCMDESYYTILTKEKNDQGKGVRKGYIWAALANNRKLIQYFYCNGSRSKEVLTGYIGQQYKGAIQSDGLANYKIFETDQYPDTIRLGCFQHCKRQFLDIEGDEDATEVTRMINQFYQKEHQMDKDQEPVKKHKFRQKYAPALLKKLKQKLQEIQSDPAVLPKSPLKKAVNYTLNEFGALSNYILKPEYALDNNAIERYMRYISLSRKNSLFCASHKGAERTALIYSLACSCRMNDVNSFEYFSDILNRLPYISPNAPDQTYMELLPNQWKKMK